MDIIIQGIKQLLVVISGATLMVFSPGELPPESEESVPVAEHAAVADTSADDSKMVTISGEETYLGKGVKYTMRFPESGGSIEGNFRGLCEGDLDGNYEGGDHGKAEVHAEGKCNVSFIEKKIKVDYDGTINVSEGNTSGKWTGNFPFKDKGSLYLTFKVQ